MVTLHFVELPKIPRDLPAAQSSDPVLNWAKFFAATTDEERHEIAMSDIQLKSLEEALRELSDDSLAQFIAEKRERDIFNFQARAKRKMEQEVAEQVEKQVAERQRTDRIEVVEQICAALGVELDDSRRQRLQTMKDDELSALPGEIAKRREWPE